jgi:hypothetical protein
MNAKEIKQIRKQTQNLMKKVGEVLNDQEMGVVHIVISKFYGEVCIETGMPKEVFMEQSSRLWDALMEDLAEETKH